MSKRYFVEAEAHSMTLRHTVGGVDAEISGSTDYVMSVLADKIKRDVQSGHEVHVVPGTPADYAK